MPLKGKIVVLRFSAMGDVAMVAAVLQSFLAQHPSVQVIMVSRPSFEPFFTGMARLTFHPIHPKHHHKGTVGIFKLYRELLVYKPTAVADLHDNLRSRLLCTFFRLIPLRIKRIDKGRAEKWALTRKIDKVLRQLKPTVERYADVFRNLGFKLRLDHKLVRKTLVLGDAAGALFSGGKKKFIGISPFAQHTFKMYPLAKMGQVIQGLNELDITIFIFGGGEAERKVGAEWESEYANVHNLIGKFTLSDELAIMSRLTLMISMDSSGMHMSSLVGVPVISIWGPTHPYAGFLGYGQSIDDCIQIDHPSRPSSIYGNKPCLCGEVPCIEMISPTLIIETVKKKLTYG